MHPIVGCASQESNRIESNRIESDAEIPSLVVVGLRFAMRRLDALDGCCLVFLVPPPPTKRPLSFQQHNNKRTFLLPASPHSQPHPPHPSAHAHSTPKSINDQASSRAGVVAPIGLVGGGCLPGLVDPSPTWRAPWLGDHDLVLGTLCSPGTSIPTYTCRDRPASHRRKKGEATRRLWCVD